MKIMAKLWHHDGDFSHKLIILFEKTELLEQRLLGTVLSDCGDEASREIIFKLPLFCLIFTVVINTGMQAKLWGAHTY